MVRQRRPRRGVLLLIVLSILVLFVLAGVTFIVVAGHYSRGAIIRSQVELTGDKPSRQLESAMYEILRDTTNMQSSLRHHSLLGDLYGNDGFVGRAQGVDTRRGPTTADGQLVQLAFLVERGLSPIVPFIRPADYYNGAVITMISGPARGLSARIISSPDMQTGPPFRLITEAFISDQNEPIAPLRNDRFVVNGVPFNGSGFGYNVQTGKLDLTGFGLNSQTGTYDLPIPRVALSPNFNAFQTIMGPIPPIPDPRLTVDVGGADESYDAVDPQNMFMAKVPPTAVSSAEITPSYHQPPLIRFWMNQALQDLKDEYGDPVPADILRDILRPFVLRPTQLDHPNFSGSNPLFAINRDNTDQLLQRLLLGPWDVDNDGDGVADSVWLDLGFPISTTPDGRLYRPLFAVMCTDLDGRLNLNVHGNLDQARRLLQGRESISDAGMVAGTGVTTRPARGLGYGPPEVNLGAVFNVQDYARLLESRYATRSGADNAFVPGQPGVDGLDVLKSADVPRNYETLTQTPAGVSRDLGAYASPPDLSGRGVVVLDHAGQPLFVDFLEPGRVDQTLDDPYELNVNQPNGGDSLFTVEQLERVLRAHDVDATNLSRRLPTVAPQAFAGAQAEIMRRMVTTHSFNVPVPNVQLPPAMRVPSGATPTSLPPTLVSWMQNRLRLGGVVANRIPYQLRLMLPFEIRHGQKLDLNRQWSNKLNDFGRGDINGSGTADGDLAMEAAMDLVFGPQQQYLLNYVNDDELNDARRNGTPQYAEARQMFARHLYCITMMLLDPNYVDPTISNTIAPNSQQARELTARRIAQWAINVVDFRDPDSIMTPFEYDWNPMNGWQETIDGNPATRDEPTDGGLTERRLIWGCEYPHLVLTETLAFHDTRLIDSEWDTGPEKPRDEDGDGKSTANDEDTQEPDDNDLDQFRIPQGSFFAELYCTFDANNRHPSGTVRVAPPELYTYDPTDTDRPWKLDLGRVPPEPRNDRGVYPIWRMAISDFHVTDESVYERLQPHPDTTTLQPERMDIFTNERVPIDRVVWFTAARPTPSTYERERIFWNRMGKPSLLAGKQYAVVGPRPATMIGTAESPSGVGNVPSDREISLNHVPGNSVFIPPNYPTDLQRPIGIVAAMDPPTTWTDPRETSPNGIGVSISEPLPTGTRYYPQPNHRINQPQRFPFRDAYGIEGTSPEKLPDEPYDHRPGRPLEEAGLLGEGTVEDVRTVFLQRLANPRRPWNPPPGSVDSLGRALPYDQNLPVNPYITVDWLPVDLTVFNGDDRAPSEDTPLRPWTDDEPWNSPQSPLLGEQPREFRFSTRERGDEETRQQPNVLRWTISEDELPETNPMGNVKNFFRDSLNHTLGFLNSTYGPRRAPGGNHRYVGDPQRPFPWLTWNDRPYANQMELMLVPATSPSRLLLEFTTDTRENPYRGGFDNQRAPFEHLLNFFHSSKTQTAVGQTGRSPNLQRLLELVEVPSRFVGTERWYNPTMFSRPETSSNDWTSPTFSFRPPFNKLSRFRDPGRININTIFDVRVWRAIADGFPRKSLPAFWQDLVRSRQGYDLNDQLQFPSEFANPFRSSLGADLQFDLMYPGQDKLDVEATLLRSDPDNPDQPLFEYDSNQLSDDTDENPYFRYQFLRRLGNVVGTQSNVYAVWITMGFFEVDPQTNTLSQELNVDTGEVKRHRAFYLIDRSIPVAFEPGENHNVDRAVMLRRFIE